MSADEPTVPAPVRADVETSFEDASFEDFLPGRRRKAMKWRIAFCSFAIATAGVLAWITGLPSIQACTFKIATGHPCPGCGMTRSVTTLARGDLFASLRFHPLGVVLVGLTAASLIGALIGLRTGRDPIWEWLDRRASRVAIALIVGLFALWVVRAYLVPEWSPDPITDGHGWGWLPLL